LSPRPHPLQPDDHPCLQVRRSRTLAFTQPAILQHAHGLGDLLAPDFECDHVGTGLDPYAEPAASAASAAESAAPGRALWRIRTQVPDDAVDRDALRPLQPSH